MKWNELKRQKLEAEFAAVGEACKAIFWHIPGRSKRVNLREAEYRNVSTSGMHLKAVKYI